jgi:excisionase family DNA binding protein
VDDRPNYLTTAEVAATLGYSVSQVQRWCDCGKLRAYQIGGRYGEYRIPPDAVDEVLAEVEPKGAPAGRRKPAVKPAGRTRQAAADKVLDGAGI